MKMVAIMDTTRENLRTIKKLLSEVSNESMGQIMDRLVRTELDEIHDRLAEED